MSNTKAHSNTIYVNFNLVFDYNSLVFCVLRSYLLSKGLNLGNDQRYLFELKTPSEAFHAIPDSIKSLELIESEFLDLFSSYSQAIKPVIGSIDTIVYLRTQGFQITLYTEVQNVFDSVTRDHQAWLGDSNLVHVTDATVLIEKENVVLICDGNTETVSRLLLRRQESHSLNTPKLIYIRNEDFHNKQKQFSVNGADVNAQRWEDLKWVEIFSGIVDIQEEIAFSPPEYFLQLKRAPNGKDMLGFNTTIPLINPVKWTSTVIAGQGKASKELGIPTANLQVTPEIELQLQNFLTGVYLGNALLHGKEYRALYFVGSSQYFENAKKQVECYLYNEFEDNFYGELIQCNVTSFSRPEADFKQFDHLIRAIHCDHAQGQVSN